MGANSSLILWCHFRNGFRGQVYIHLKQNSPTVPRKVLTFWTERFSDIWGVYDKFPDFHRSNLFQLQCTCCTVPTTSGRPHWSPLVWACQWPLSQPLSSPQLSHNDSLWAEGITKSHRERGVDYREGEELSWCPSWSNSLWQGRSCGLVHWPRGNATDPIWRVLASSERISFWTPLKPQHSNLNHLANQLCCIDFLTPSTPLIIPHRLRAFLEYLMQLKNWWLIHARWSKSSLKHSLGFCGILSKFKTQFYCISLFYRVRLYF